MTTETKVVAHGKLGDHDIEAEVLNPGDWWGMAWLIEIGCGYGSIYYVVEAGSDQAALDEFADSDKGHHIIIEESRYGEFCQEFTKGDMAYGKDITESGYYDLNGKYLGTESPSMEEPCFLGNAGTPCELINVRIHGVCGIPNGKGMPWPCDYHGEGLPELGLAADRYEEAWKYNLKPGQEVCIGWEDARSVYVKIVEVQYIENDTVHIIHEDGESTVKIKDLEE